MNLLEHRAAAAIAAIESADTPLRKQIAQEEAFALKIELEKQLGSDNAVAAIKAAHAKPKNSFGMFKAAPVSDQPIFMAGPTGTKITDPIALPDGTKAAPNPQGQIVVPARYVPAMIVRGFVRSNSVITQLDTTASNPPHLNNVAGS